MDSRFGHAMPIFHPDAYDGYYEIYIFSSSFSLSILSVSVKMTTDSFSLFFYLVWRAIQIMNIFYMSSFMYATALLLHRNSSNKNSSVECEFIQFKPDHPLDIIHARN